MANYKLLKRLNSIMHLMKSYPNISKQHLLERLYDDYGMEVAERTLERDFTNLKNEFGLDVIYNYDSKGYSVEDTAQLTTFFKFAELSSLAELYAEGLKDYETFQKWIIPDDSERFKGIEHLKPILNAITQSLKLKFDKVNYYRKTEKQYTVTPIRIKEYLNRWYLVAVPDGQDEIRNFGIDRISNLVVTNKPARKSSNFEEQLKNYEDIVGLNYNESINKEPEDVIVKTTNKQLKYLRSLPLHKSQVCIDGQGGSNWGRATYHLKPNYEFMTQLLRMADQVEVVEPQWLRNRMKGFTERMYNLYK
ncbi:helix-turn-helix transcriptional regulator [Croceibacter atlanticus]|uniref:helix-turn-helix transcriptional regulator n=1 Tax=Croceibacter atlanticus TaxID=313588 RepID=UPI000C8DBB29|nr:WYL domain-containing protein [Croceibacter atlanticus]MAM23221.1 hypothetical protein [Croceibacter sp.]